MRSFDWSCPRLPYRNRYSDTRICCDDKNIRMNELRLFDDDGGLIGAHRRAAMLQAAYEELGLPPVAEGITDVGLPPVAEGNTDAAVHTDAEEFAEEAADEAAEDADDSDEDSDMPPPLTPGTPVGLVFGPLFVPDSSEQDSSEEETDDADELHH